MTIPEVHCFLVELRPIGPGAAGFGFSRLRCTTLGQFFGLELKDG
jgi:hypothetical protein